MRYTLSFPFELAPGQQLSGLDKPIEREFESLSLTIARQGGGYLLRAEGFTSEQEAQAFADRFRTALTWLLLKNGMAFNANLDFHKVAFGTAKDFDKSLGVNIDGLADGNRPYVYPSNKHIGALLWGRVDGIVGRNVENIFFAMKELFTDNTSKIVLEPKLKTALELYNTYYYQNSENAKFLTLIMALETLTTNPDKHKVALDLLEQWKQQVKKQKAEYEQNSDESEALEALEGELLFRKKASLGSQLRTLVRETLESAGNPNAAEYVKQVNKLYKQRGQLVHEGSLPSDELRFAVERAKEIVESVLKAKFYEAISGKLIREG